MRFSIGDLLRATLTAAIVLALARLSTPLSAGLAFLFALLFIAWLSFGKRLLLALAAGVFAATKVSISADPDGVAYGLMNLCVGGGCALAVWLVWFPHLWRASQPSATNADVLTLKKSVAKAGFLLLGLQVAGAVALVGGAVNDALDWRDAWGFLVVIAAVNAFVLLPWVIGAFLLARPANASVSMARPLC